ncbi:MAG: hypothetical protein KH415_10535 [Clostridium sp.]|nr:hypothetical protein [Clostridium sp.]
MDMSILIMNFTMIVIILIGIKFYIDLITNNINGSSLIVLIRGIVAILVSMALLSIIPHKIEEIFQIGEIINRYSFIPLYLFFHILLWLVISFFIFLFAFIMYYIWLLLVEGVLLFIKKMCKEILLSFDERLLYLSKRFIKFINKYINPFYSLRNYKLSITKSIKIWFILSYLLSGIILLSPITKYMKILVQEELIKLENKYQEAWNRDYEYLNEVREIQKSFSSEDFKNDYDLYKNVFIISLIPFSLSYIFKEVNYSEKLEEFK